MKNIFLAVLLGLSICASMNAQQVFIAGFKGGTNFSAAKSDAFAEKMNFGWEAGVYAGVNILPLVGLQAEGIYGWTSLTTLDYKTDEPNGIAKGRKKLDYFSIPILVRLNLGPVFTINAGPQLNVLMEDDKYLMNNNEPAFEKRSTSWVAGFEVNSDEPVIKVYGRVTWGKGIENIGDGVDAKFLRFQLGLLLPILNK